MQRLFKSTANREDKFRILNLLKSLLKDSQNAYDRTIDSLSFSRYISYFFHTQSYVCMYGLVLSALDEESK